MCSSKSPHCRAAASIARRISKARLAAPGLSALAASNHADTQAWSMTERTCQLVVAIGAVGKHDLHRVLTGLQRQQQGTRAIPILDMRRMDLGGQRVAVDGKVTLAALDRLAGIVAASLATRFDRRRALTVDNARQLDPVQSM